MTSMDGAQNRNAKVTLTADTAGYSQPVQEAAKNTNTLNSALDALAVRLDGITKRAGRRMLNFAGADAAALGVMLTQAAGFDKQLSTLNATAAITDLRMGQVRGQVAKLTSKFPETRTEAAQLLTVLSNLGVTGAKQMGDLAQTFIKLGAATGESIPGLAQNLTQLSRQMGTTDAAQIAKYANALLTVSKNAGVSATGVLQFAQAIAPLAHQAGIGETAVLGISTAFNKAGADGFPAVNAFNSMVQDITQSIATGSPDINKYANLIGVTADQFKKMDKSEAITEIFEAISKQGPQAINTLNRLGIDGVRAQSAIAAVTSSNGGLRKAISDAQGSSQDTGNLDKGGRAAMSGLSDNLVKLRSAFSQFGVDIGTTLLPAVNAIVKALTTMLHVTESVVKPFAPLISVLAALAGVLTTVGGAGLLAAGVIAKVALGRFALGSAPVRGLAEGVRAGRNPETARTSTVRAINAYTTPAGQPGAMRWHQRLPFAAGLGIGGLRPASAAMGEPGTAEGPMYGPATLRQARTAQLRELASARAVIRGTGAATRGLISGQRDYLNNSNRGWLDRSSPVMDSLGRGALRARSALGIGDKQANAEAMARAASAKQLSELERAAKASAASTVRGGGAVGELGTQARRTSVELMRLYATTAKVGVVQAGAIGKAGARAVPGALATGIGRTSQAAMGFLGGPIGVGLIGGLAAFSAYKGWQHANKASEDYSGSLDPVAKLNDRLGITTSKLAGFSSGLDTATGTLLTKWQQSLHVTAADSANAGSAKYSSDLIPSLAKHGSDTTAIVSSLSALHLSDPKQVDAVRADLVKALGAERAQRVLDAYGAAGGTQAKPDYASIGAAVSKTEDRKHWLGVNGLGTSTRQSKTGRDLYGNALSSIDNTAANSQAAYGKDNKAGVALSQAERLRSIVELVSGIDVSKTGGYKAANSILSSAQGLGKGAFANFDTSEYFKLRDPKAKQDYIYSQLSQEASVKNYLKAAGLDSYDTSSLGALAGNTPTLSRLAENAKVGAVAGQNGGSPFAQAVAGNAVLSAAHAQPEDANLQFQGVIEMFNTALKQAGGNLSATSEVLDNYKAAINDSTDTFYRLADAAKQYAARQQAYQTPSLSRVDQLGQASQNYSAARNADPQGIDYQANLASSQDSYESAKESYRQYMVQTMQMATQYKTQMEDAAADRHTSLGRAERDFNLQMSQGAADYYKGRGRQVAAFNLQMSQSDADYTRSRTRQIAAFNLQMSQGEADHQRSVLRSTRDFGIQLARQARSSAESIYNPFTRVQAEYTTDAGTLVQNLQDQNQRIAAQLTQLRQAKKMGLSQDSIDTLKLADPGNAQQLNNIVSSLGQNPQLVAQINKTVSARVKTTTALTQSSFSETFRNTVTDFNRSLKDAETDYGISQRRARAAQSLALSQMADDYAISRRRAQAAESLALSQQDADFQLSRQRAVIAQRTALKDQAADYQTMINRSARDLATSMHEITGTFGSVYARTMAAVSGQLKKYAPEAAKTILAALDTIAAKYPDLLKPTATGTPLDVAGKPLAGQNKMDKVKGTYAYGGIATAPHVGLMGEAGAELNLPLGERGHAFMAGMYQAVGNQVAAQMRTAGRGVTTVVAQGGGTTMNDYSTNFTGPVTVQASDPNRMAKELANRARIKKLARPPRATGSP